MLLIMVHHKAEKNPTWSVDSDSASSAMTFSSILSKAVSALLVLRPWIISVICLLADADLARAFSVSFFDLASVSFCSSILVARGSV
jgi:hypothetical protein